jgi:K+-sensing histidine kinase KdpD
VLLVIFGVNKVAVATGASWLGYLSGLLTILIFFYNYKAMRNFYQQGRAKTLLKFLILHFVNLIIASILFIAFTFLSLLKI